MDWKIRIGKPKLRLQTTITLLVCIVVVMALFVTEILITNRISQETKKGQEEKATDIARIVAQSPLVINGLHNKKAEKDIQSFANDLKRSTHVEFIVVMDMHGIRKSHPNRNLLGLHFVGGDEGPVLKGKSIFRLPKEH